MEGIIKRKKRTPTERNFIILKLKASFSVLCIQTTLVIHRETSWKWVQKSFDIIGEF